MARCALRIYLLLLTFIILLTLAGCASLKELESWRKTTIREQRYQKVMIIAIARDENLRKMIENILVDELAKGQVTAEASHTIVPDLEKTDRERFIAAVRAAGCDAVLVGRALAKGNTNVTQDGPVGYVYGAGAKASFDFVNATLQTSLFDAASEELLWSATFKTFDADREAHVSRELGRYLLQTLRTNGLI